MICCEIHERWSFGREGLPEEIGKQRGLPVRDSTAIGCGERYQPGYRALRDGAAQGLCICLIEVPCEAQTAQILQHRVGIGKSSSSYATDQAAHAMADKVNRAIFWDLKNLLGEF